MGESTVTRPIRVPITLIEKMKADGFTENFGYYLQDIYNEKRRRYYMGEILSK